MIHTLAHWFKWNRVKRISSYDKVGNLWSASECIGCGEITDKRVKTVRQQKISEFLERFETVMSLCSPNVNGLGGSIQKNTNDTVKFKRPISYKSTI